ncbi:MAG: septum formation initiator family protein [Candidatus Sericytochromatia bacterium]|nr:septum formation initiator family protein [Candidatus Sericytochromatia bacterium]
MVAAPSLFSTLAFLGVVLYLGGLIFRLGLQEVHLLRQAGMLKAEKVAVEAQHRDLRSQIAAAKTNAGVERLAREQLGFVMDREIPVKAVSTTPQEVKSFARAGSTDSRSTKAVGLPPAMAALAKFFVPLWK